MSIKRKINFVLSVLIIMMAMFVGPHFVKASGDVAINANNFPDIYFRSEVLRVLDGPVINGKLVGKKDGILTAAEINVATQIDVSELRVVSLKGVEYLTKLEVLICYDNYITSVDLSKNTELKTLSISSNSLTKLDLSKNTKLTSLDCRSNKLTSLNLSQQTQLSHLECQKNSLTSLDLSKNTQLDWLDCSYNSLTSLNLSANTKLGDLVCSNNKLTSLDVSKNVLLASIDCSDNQLTGLNTSGNTNLMALLCRNNKITSLNLSNNKRLVQVLCGKNALKTLEIPNGVNSNYGLEYLEYENQTGMAPSSVSAIANKQIINVSWKSITGATGYELYRLDNTYKNWERVAAKEITGTSYSDSNIRASETYKYKLYAFQKTATSKKYLTYALGTSTAKTIVPVPQNLKTSVATANSITISWTGLNNVYGYEVYASTSKNGAYTLVGAVAGNSFTHLNLNAGTTYYYKLRAYAQLGVGNSVYGDYSVTVSRKQTVPKVSGIKIANSSADSLKLSWNGVADASGYEIYQATKKNGKYKKVATIGKGSTVTRTVKKLSYNKTYYFKIRAYRTVNSTKKYSAYSAIIGKKVILTKPVLTVKAKSKTAMSLSWEKVSGAKQYEIYRATSKKGTYKKIATTKSLKYTNTKLKKNKAYFYKIKAVQKIGSKTYRSAYSTMRSAKTKK